MSRAVTTPRSNSRGWRRRVSYPVLLCLLISGLRAASVAQKAEKTALGNRKLVSRVEPDYPWDLRRAHIGGIVRMDVVVSPRGSVDTIDVIGGNPILAETASKAVKRWKYAPADAETVVRINVEFNPND